MKITTDFILKTLTDYVENKVQLDGHQWLDSAAKLNVLVYQEQDKLYLMEQELAKAKMMRIEAGDSVAKAKAWIETTDLYRETAKQRAKIDRVDESIRISKIQARMKDNEYRNQ